MGVQAVFFPIVFDSRMSKKIKFESLALRLLAQSNCVNQVAWSAQAKQISVSFVFMHQARFILSSSPIVSIYVYPNTVFSRFDRCLNKFQSIKIFYCTLAKLFCIWNFLFAARFGYPWVNLKGPLISFGYQLIVVY